MGGEGCQFGPQPQPSVEKPQTGVRRNGGAAELADAFLKVGHVIRPRCTQNDMPFPGSRPDHPPKHRRVAAERIEARHDIDGRGAVKADFTILRRTAIAQIARQPIQTLLKIGPFRRRNRRRGHASCGFSRRREPNGEIALG